MKNNDQKNDSLSSVPRPSSFEDFARQDYKERMSAYANKTGQGNKRMSSLRRSDGNLGGDPETNELVQRLALQSYHLPGNSWLQDWWQFMTNNHPVFGICCHNKLHPIKSVTRIVALLGTITFGLAITNLCYVFFLWNPEFDRVVASLSMDDGSEIVLTTGMLLLWTVGGGIHCMFNLAMWHIAACACCRSGGCLESYACCPSLGKYMIRFFILCIGAFATLIIVLRVATDDQPRAYSRIADDGNYTGTEGVNLAFDDQLDLTVDDVSEFDFVLNYLVEMTLAFFVYYPICGTILFSGILSCDYNIPVLGGRPYEISCEERRKSKRQKRGSADDLTLRGSSSNV